MFPVSAPGACMASSLMEFPCRFHGGFCRFHAGSPISCVLNVVVAWGLLADAVFVEVPCRFHVGAMEN